MPIHILPPEVANQIAAGEVVERPASAVKELVENSLDAGATDVRVEIREGGRRLLRVQDNGAGIPAAEVALAFQRHATSKIASAADLDHITTLGFRGEALASIAAVAQVTLLTHSREEETGILVRMVDGREAGREPAGGPAGTVVTVEHLFANVPARLKFLKQPATEAGHIQQIVTRYAVAYPERRFSFTSDGKLIFQSTGSGKLYDVLVKAYGLDMAQQMLQIADLLQIADPAWQMTDGTGEAPDVSGTPDRVSGAPDWASSPQPPAIRVTGYVGSPSLHRGNRGYITMFVNRRWFQDTSLAYSVIQAYHTMLPIGRYPVAVLLIDMEPADVDVNVHPTKAEVRFRDSHAVFSAVQRAVRRTVADHAPIPQVDLGEAGPTTGSRQDAWGGTGPSSADSFGGPSWTERRDALLNAGSDQRRLFAAPTFGAEAPALEEQLPPSDTQAAKPLLPLLRVVGQLAATYIVTEGPDGLYLIDQHAAHERILYEQMTAQRTGHTLAIQPLLEPLVLDLNPEQAAVTAEELGTLNELGVSIEPFGGSSYLVRSIPAILSREDPVSALVEIIDGFASQADVVEDSREAALVTLICKRAAVKGGHPLSVTEMQELVRQLEACRSPRTCPHGRPTMIYLSAGDLARQFGRV